MYSDNGLQEVPIYEGDLSSSMSSAAEEYIHLPDFADYSLFEDCLDKKPHQSSQPLSLHQQLTVDAGRSVKVEEDDCRQAPPQPRPAADLLQYAAAGSCRYAGQQAPVNNNSQQPINLPNQSMVQQQSQMPLCPPQQSPTPPAYQYTANPAYPQQQQQQITNNNSQPSPQYEHMPPAYANNNNNNNNSPASYSPNSPYSSSLGSPMQQPGGPGEEFMPLRQALFNRHAASMQMQGGPAATAAGYGMQFGAFYEQQMLEHGSKRRKHDFELTPEEYEKRRLRRERNKQAALRCRQRRRERIDELEKETAKIEEENSAQRQEIQRLETQVGELMKMLKEHKCPGVVVPAVAQQNEHSQCSSLVNNPAAAAAVVPCTPAVQSVVGSASVIQQAAALSTRSVRTLSTFDINMKHEN